MCNRNISSPDTLVEIEAVLGKTAGIQHSCVCRTVRPVGFSQIINTCPHEISCHIIMSHGITKQASHLYRSTVIWTHPPACFFLHAKEIPSSHSTKSAILCTNHAPVGVFTFILIIVSLCPCSPSAHIVISDYIQFV